MCDLFCLCLYGMSWISWTTSTIMWIPNSSVILFCSIFAGETFQPVEDCSLWTAHEVAIEAPTGHRAPWRHPVSAQKELLISCQPHGHPTRWNSCAFIRNAFKKTRLKPLSLIFHLRAISYCQASCKSESLLKKISPAVTGRLSVQRKELEWLKWFQSYPSCSWSHILQTDSGTGALKVFIYSSLFGRPPGIYRLISVIRVADTDRWGPEVKCGGHRTKLGYFSLNRLQLRRPSRTVRLVSICNSYQNGLRMFVI